MKRDQIAGTLGIQSDRLLGALALAAGELDRSADHFENSLAFCRKSGYRPELAWTRTHGLVEPNFEVDE